MITGLLTGSSPAVIANTSAAVIPQTDALGTRDELADRFNAGDKSNHGQSDGSSDEDRFQFSHTKKPLRAVGLSVPASGSLAPPRLSRRALEAQSVALHCCRLLSSRRTRAGR